MKELLHDDDVREEGSVRRENRKQYVDKIAAVFILQGYLDLLSMRNGADGED